MLILLLDIADNTYAIKGSDIVEIVPCIPLQNLAQSPSHISGWFNYREKPITVIDLSMLIHNKPTNRQLCTRNIIIEIQQPNNTPLFLGLLAEKVLETIQVNMSQIIDKANVSPSFIFLKQVIIKTQPMIQLIDTSYLLQGINFI
ncbi:MAG: CheW protein [Chlamydiales bacterium]|jgi:chemotaxis-related protein WspB|nr:CheW protein [Chlamydiales bacterium]